MCWVLLNITLILFSCSCWITWQQLFSSLTKTWTATWFPGTVLCCFMVNSSWGALLVISLFGVVGGGCLNLRVMTDFSLCIQDPRAQGRRHSAKLLRRSCQSDCQTGMTAVISEIMLHQLLLQRSNSQNYTCLTVGILTASLWRSTATACSPSGFLRLFSLVFILCCSFEWCSTLWSHYLFQVTLCLSQSGKLVTKMFQKIQQLIDDKDALVFVLIDEVTMPDTFDHSFLFLVCFSKSTFEDLLFC